MGRIYADNMLDKWTILHLCFFKGIRDERTEGTTLCCWPKSPDTLFMATVQMVVETAYFNAAGLLAMETA